MKILQRLINIWHIGELNIPKEKKEQITSIISAEKPRLAQIIKRANPTAEFLKDEPQNEPT